MMTLYPLPEANCVFKRAKTHKKSRPRRDKTTKCGLNAPKLIKKSVDGAIKRCYYKDVTIWAMQATALESKLECRGSQQKKYEERL
jgi:hypothetical protein